MSFLGKAKRPINFLLRPLNLRLESLVAERAETMRLQALDRSGHFSRPVYPVLSQFRESDPTEVFAAIQRSHGRFAEFAARPANHAAYSLNNDYYTTPDAEALYAMVQIHRPRLVVEIGSGNSTLLFREAIRDAAIPAQLVSIDPDPRRSVSQHADVSVREKIEDSSATGWFSRLQANDILFIDSSHELKAGNDVLYLLLTILPSIAPGVLIHIHDIFLPYEYPREWLVEYRWSWGEQYLVQALLHDAEHYEVLWAGHHLQQTRPDFITHFPFWRSADARSLWLRRTS